MLERCRVNTFKGARGKIKLYLILVIIPALIISFFINDKEKQKIADKHIQEASMMLNLHRNKLNYLIGETKARMTTLAIAVDKPVNEEKIIDILDQAFEDEPRFSGLYMLNSKGDVIASTTDLKSKVNLADRPYFTKAKKTKKP